MALLAGRVAIVTGAGRGIGREHALAFADEGAKVVVNDRGGANDGSGADVVPAEEVAAEIRARGGEAVANTDDVAEWDGAQRMVAGAIEAFGDLDIVVNNAGILRDRSIVKMTEEEWDSVIRVHLKGHAAPTHWAAAYWRDEHKAGRGKPRNLVHTSSTSGLFANPGQSNYGAAKTGIATLSQIAAKELTRYGVVSNTIAPAARTRLTLAAAGLEELMAVREGQFDEWDPANVAPLAVFLASAGCTFNGETFYVHGGTVTRVASWAMGPSVTQDARWSAQELGAALGGIAAP